MPTRPLTLEQAIGKSGVLRTYRLRSIPPAELPEKLAQLHQDLRIEYDQALSVYRLAEAPDIAFTYMHDDMLYVKMALLKLQPENEKEPRWVIEKVFLRTHVEIMLAAVLNRAGYNVEALLRRHKLRALLS